MTKMPLGWSKAKIGDLCDLVNGRAFKPSDWTSVGLPIVRIQNLNRSDAKFNYFDREVEEKFLVEPGDLLFAWSGTPGTSFGAHIWNGPKAILNQHIFNVRYDRRAVDKSFFRYAINQTLDEQIAKAHGGVGLRHVTKGKFEETIIALPPMPEQQRIVVKIDSLSDKSKRARNHLGHIPRLVGKYKQAILAAAFRREWDENDAAPLGKRSEFVTSGSRGWAKFYSEGGARFIRVGNVQRLNVSLDWSDTQMVSPPEGTEGQRTRVHPNDLVITITADLGRVGLVPPNIGEAYVNQHVALVRLHTPSEAAFVAWYLSSDLGQEQLLERNRGATRAGLGLDDIRAVRVPIASPEARKAIVGHIERAFAQIDRLAVEATSARKLIGHLDQAVLAKAFRGELVPQNPDDEPASVLLDSLKSERVDGSSTRRGRRAQVRKNY